jgi:hypothetical protein
MGLTAASSPACPTDPVDNVSRETLRTRPQPFRSASPDPPPGLFHVKHCRQTQWIPGHAGPNGGRAWGRAQSGPTDRPGPPPGLFHVKHFDAGSPAPRSYRRGSGIGDLGTGTPAPRRGRQNAATGSRTSDCRHQTAPRPPQKQCASNFQTITPVRVRFAVDTVLLGAILAPTRTHPH